MNANIRYSCILRQPRQVLELLSRHTRHQTNITTFQSRLSTSTITERKKKPSHCPAKQRHFLGSNSPELLAKSGLNKLGDWIQTKHSDCGFSNITSQNDKFTIKGWFEFRRHFSSTMYFCFVSMRRCLGGHNGMKQTLPWIDVISEDHQVIFPRFVLDKVKWLLDVTHNNASSHRV